MEGGRLTVHCSVAVDPQLQDSLQVEYQRLEGGRLTVSFLIAIDPQLQRLSPR